MALGLGVPRSAVNGWLRYPPPRVITLDVLRMDVHELQRLLVKLRQRVRILTTVVGLLIAVIRALGATLEFRTVREPKKRRLLTGAVERERAVLPLKSVLRLVGLFDRGILAFRQIAVVVLEHAGFACHCQPLGRLLCGQP
ncbi:MAG: hypothetical protein ACI9OJ_002891 [Myxococcota bacterium]|jgi:hypothetical protein